jgi:nitrite reductase/ring-hydroxylating ferredoxin subunit
MKRRNFVQHICPSLAVFALTNACKQANDPEPLVKTPEIQEFERVATKYNDDGFYLDGNLVFVNLSNPTFSKLGNISGYVNMLDAGVLLLRTDEKTLKAFSNCCPHQGIRGAWDFVNGRFRCDNHGNSYNVNEVNVASCSSNSVSGGLQRFQVLAYQNFLKITKV